MPNKPSDESFVGLKDGLPIADKLQRLLVAEMFGVEEPAIVWRVD
jgi:hypothetical protein